MKELYICEKPLKLMKLSTESFASTIIDKSFGEWFVVHKNKNNVILEQYLPSSPNGTRMNISRANFENHFKKTQPTGDL